MYVPTIRGRIQRRLLINYRADPEILASLLPPPFRPQQLCGYGVAGICLIRLGELRPRHWPRWLGLCSENAAHRIAVEWNEGDEIRTGVYIFRRDTNSRLSALAGGRIFPGVHHFSRFQVRETDHSFQVAVQSDDEMALHVEGRRASSWPADSLFSSIGAASQFFEAGAVGYSPLRNSTALEGLELRCQSWSVEPLAITAARSSLFDNERVFPDGSIELDCGLVMCGVQHEWHTLPRLQCAVDRDNRFYCRA